MPDSQNELFEENCEYTDVKISEIGALGEQLVCDRLISEGCEIIARNFHSRYGEIDIIAKDGKYILFVEVKTRAKGSMVGGLEAVTLTKRRKICKTALVWLGANQTKLTPRLDVCEVITEKANEFTPVDLVYIKNAFDAEEY